METLYFTAEIVTGCLVVIAALAFAFTYGKARLGKETLDLMTKNKQAQDDAIKLLQDDAVDKEQRGFLIYRDKLMCLKMYHSGTLARA